VFIDLSKAADAISHAELLKKIPFYEIHGKPIIGVVHCIPFL